MQTRGNIDSGSFGDRMYSLSNNPIQEKKYMAKAITRDNGVQKAHPSA